MLFNSLEYFLLLMVSVVIYWGFYSLRLRQATLLVASMIFYASWSVPLIFLLFSAVSISWFLSIKYFSVGKRWPIVAAIIINLSILCFFKYFNFFLDNIRIIFELIGLTISVPKYNILLPLGISFYTFQIIAYTVDVYRKQVTPEKNFFSFALFIMFFPQLIAGPICRAKQLLPQLKTKMNFEADTFVGGILILVVGLFLKVTFADGLAPYVDDVFANPGKTNGAEVFWITLGYGIQIFCDFWGYSTMAVGSAMLFGYRLPINFNLPYYSLSIREFWRRWHITLSSWLRDYLYISLGGSRFGSLLTTRNLLLTMLLGGLWHGAAWNFIVWGLIHALALISERIVNNNVKFVATNNLILRLSIGMLRWLKTMAIVFFAWIFFRAASIDDAFTIIKHILTDFTLSAGGLGRGFFALLIGFTLFHWVFHQIIATVYSDKKGHLFTRMGASIVLIVLAVIFSAEETQKFIYFEF